MSPKIKVPVMSNMNKKKIKTKLNSSAVKKSTSIFIIIILNKDYCKFNEYYFFHTATCAANPCPGQVCIDKSNGDKRYTCTSGRWSTYINNFLLHFL